MNIGTKEKLALLFVGCLFLLAAGMRIYNFAKPVRVAQNIDDKFIATNIDDNQEVASSSEIIIDQPLSGDSMTAPFAVAGKARGSWFFEGSFPLKIINEQDKVIGNGLATAQMDWMTNDYVPFVGFLEFSSGEIPASGTKAFLVLLKDNPSGLVEHDISTSVPIIIN